MKAASAVVMLVFLYLCPERALDAARGAMRLWAASVAPSVFPFLVVLPSLTEALQLGLRTSNPMKKRRAAIGLAVITGLFAGSPAGAIAVSRAWEGHSVSHHRLLAVALLASGVGPLFLISGVAVGILGKATLGLRLVAAQCLSLVSSAVWVLSVGARKSVVVAASSDSSSAPQGVASSAFKVIGIGGWMVWFAVIRAALQWSMERFGAGGIGLYIACPLEIAAGMATLVTLPLPGRLQFTLMGALTGLGGICLLCQNMVYYRRIGIRIAELALGKLFQGLLCAAYCALLYPRTTTDTALAMSMPVEEMGILMAALLLAGALCWGIASMDRVERMNCVGR